MKDGWRRMKEPSSQSSLRDQNRKDEQTLIGLLCNALLAFHDKSARVGLLASSRPSGL
jgi:hypothetical protein